MGFSEGLLFGTIVEVSDIANLEETLQTRRPHEEITRQIHEIIKTRSKRTMALSTEACTHCKKCAYPDGPCRFPEKMYPCVESHGIVVSDIAEKYGIDFLAGGNIVTWFSLILYEWVDWTNINMNKKANTFANQRPQRLLEGRFWWMKLNCAEFKIAKTNLKC